LPRLRHAHARRRLDDVFFTIVGNLAMRGS
jgi:hypothetical protein